MEFSAVKFLELLLLPPGSIIILIAMGLVCIRYSIRWGIGIISIALVSFYMLSTPFFAGVLYNWSSPYPALSEDRISNSTEDAIVILGGGRLHQQPEYGGDTVSRFSLQRIRYGAWLKRRTYLPLYVSGGKHKHDLKSEAELMRVALQKEFGVEVDAVESNSKTTYENAKYSAKILKYAGHHKILLVSHAAHMPRAVEAFEHFDIEVTAAPTVHIGTPGSSYKLNDFLPQAFAFSHSYFVLHEFVGRLWYRLRYY